MPETRSYSAVCAIYTFWLAARARGLGVGWVSILDPAPLAEWLDGSAGMALHRLPLRGVAGRDERRPRARARRLAKPRHADADRPLSSGADAASGVASGAMTDTTTPRDGEAPDRPRAAGRRPHRHFWARAARHHLDRAARLSRRRGGNGGAVPLRRRGHGWTDPARRRGPARPVEVARHGPASARRRRNRDPRNQARQRRAGRERRGDPDQELLAPAFSHRRRRARQDRRARRATSARSTRCST